MKNVLFLIPSILNPLLINALYKLKKSTFLAIFYSQLYALGTLGAIFSNHHIKVFYGINFTLHSQPIAYTALQRVARHVHMYTSNNVDK